MPHNLFYTKHDQRIFEWRNFRNRLAASLTPIEEVVEWASHAPLGTHSIDCWSAEEWPTAWELVDEGEYCEFSIALLMEYTLGVAFPDRYKLELILIENREEKILRLCVRVDGAYLLNYEQGAVVVWDDIANTTHIHDIFQMRNGKHETV